MFFPGALCLLTNPVLPCVVLHGVAGPLLWGTMSFQRQLSPDLMGLHYLNKNKKPYILKH